MSEVAKSAAESGCGSVLPLRWAAPPREFSLPAGEVHVWWTDIQATQSEACSGVLSVEERERAARYLLEPARLRFTLVRAVLRVLLGRYLALPPDRILLCAGAYGKPALGPGLAPRIEFNVSHSGGAALLAFAVDRQVGVDIERKRPIVELEAWLSKVFTPRERTRLAALTGRTRIDAFFAAWTRKEALLKASGKGLSGRPEAIELPEPRAGTAVFEADSGDGCVSGSWQVWQLPVGSEYAAALAVEGAGAVLRGFRMYPGRT